MKNSSMDVITGKITEITISDEEIKKEEKLAKDFEDSLTYQELRRREYPTIDELVIALYDTDDKAALVKKRADVKKKYAKPE
jgi:hypothetical protein|tara:strand:+ start:1273 stop:1518 length:246 start_codon:yes stop_codon:yes gene_type:complete